MAENQTDWEVQKKLKKKRRSRVQLCAVHLAKNNFAMPALTAIFLLLQLSFLRLPMQTSHPTTLRMRVVFK